MRVDTEENKVWVRQSWLNDVMICPERSRLSVTMPDWRQGSDATHIGTAVHAGIETILTGGSFDEGKKKASDTLNELIETEPFKFNAVESVADMTGYTSLLMETFAHDVLPHVKGGGRCEQKFGVKLFTIDNSDTSIPFEAQKPDTEVWLGGTIDYIDPDGVVWDWKTAGRKYSQGEKQRQSIQATAYAYAVVENGWAEGYPVRFNYGVMTRTKNSVGQIVPIVRTSAHVDWFKHQVQSVVQPSLLVGFDKPWIANDQHGLCSEKWCPYWSICKGSRLSGFDNNNTTIEENING